MKTQDAINHAGNAKALADLLGITPSAISQWGSEVPEGRFWQLRVLKPEWFEKKEKPAHAKHSDKPKRTTTKNEHPYGDWGRSANDNEHKTRA